MKNILEHIDFSPGVITYNQLNGSDLHDEDLLQVCYLDDLYIIDVGWYKTEFAVLVIKSLDWSTPIWEKRCIEADELHSLLHESSSFVNELISEKR